MRIVFWGSPEFAVPTLDGLLDSRHEVVGVVSQPVRPKGRGREVEPTPVAHRAESAGLPVLTPAKPRGEAFLGELRRLDADVFVVAAYGEILPVEILGMPPHGALNVHASLLPAYRGAAPVTQALLDGRTNTGITIMRMEAGLDTGPICLQAEEPIGPDDTAGLLTGRLAELGARLAVEALDRLESGTLIETPQDHAQASHAGKIDPQDARLDWDLPSAALERAVRAYDPWPGAWTTWRRERLKVFRLGIVPPPVDGSVEPGTLLEVEAESVVKTGDGAVRLVLVQPAGGRRMSGREWARGRKPRRGERLGGAGDDER
ncbi:MAG: methionyl-tRNA formyltransferase [Gemmatimonadota bacterium]